MNIDFLYSCSSVRIFIVLFQKAGIFRLTNRFLRTSLSRYLVPGYIARHQIDMRDFAGQEYRSFADFFSRKRESITCDSRTNVLVSPCDGLLSVYPVSGDMNIPMKGSNYRLTDILPEPTAAELFTGGLCMVFRLRASDYHHFCAFDDARLSETHFLPGQLHSVQPFACEKFPVYHLNQRWWTLLDTLHFGTVAQIEVGAMLVGGVTFSKETGWLYRGDEMGNFELAGSTILLLLPAEVCAQMEFYRAFQPAWNGKAEVPVKMGTGIGVRKSDKQTVGKKRTVSDVSAGGSGI